MSGGPGSQDRLKSFQERAAAYERAKADALRTQNPALPEEPLGSRLAQGVGSMMTGWSKVACFFLGIVLYLLAVILTTWLRFTYDWQNAFAVHAMIAFGLAVIVVNVFSLNKSHQLAIAYGMIPAFFFWEEMMDVIGYVLMVTGLHVPESYYSFPASLFAPTTEAAATALDAAPAQTNVPSQLDRPTVEFNVQIPEYMK